MLPVLCFSIENIILRATGPKPINFKTYVERCLVVRPFYGTHSPTKAAQCPLGRSSNPLGRAFEAAAADGVWRFHSIGFLKTGSLLRRIRSTRHTARFVVEHELRVRPKPLGGAAGINSCGQRGTRRFEVQVGVQYKRYSTELPILRKQ